MNDLHITIGSTPNISLTEDNSKIFLENDLRMVKAALLYADKVTLCSISSSTLLELSEIANLPDEKRLDFLYTILDLLPNDENVKLLKAMKSMIQDLGFDPEIILKSVFDGDGWNEIKKYVFNFIDNAGGSGIFQAIDAKLLKVHSFKSSISRLVQNSESKKLAYEYINTVSKSVSNAETYPLFDEDTNEIIRTGIQAGVFPVKDFAVTHGKETGLAADLLARLPVFPMASIEEIIEIRNELEPHLKRFRSAMIKFSDGIKNASWDEDFSFDAEQVFRRDIEPTVQMIEEEVKANKFITSLIRKFADKSSLIPSGLGTISGIGLEMSNLPKAAIVSFSMGALLGGYTAVYDTYKEWGKKNRELQQNNLFFYYKARIKQ